PERLPVPAPAACSVESKASSMKENRAQVIKQFESVYVTELLRSHQGNVSHAAQAAKMERRAFGRLIKKYQIEKRCFLSPPDSFCRKYSFSQLPQNLAPSSGSFLQTTGSYLTHSWGIFNPVFFNRINAHFRDKP